MGTTPPPTSAVPPRPPPPSCPSVVSGFRATVFYYSSLSTRPRPERADQAGDRGLCRAARGRRQGRRRRDRAADQGGREAEHPGCQEPHAAHCLGLYEAERGGPRTPPAP